MKPLIDKARLLQELVDNYDLEGGTKISPIKIYSLIRNQPLAAANISYWIPSIDGDGVRCEACNADIDLWSFNDFPFCPYCGAEMMNSNESYRDKNGYSRYGVRKTQ